jgi:AraC family transcriptional regulator
MARAERVRVASELIRTGNRPLSEIALAAGFCDQAHLTRVMRRSLGTTPGRLRRNTSRRR